MHFFFVVGGRWVTFILHISFSIHCNFIYVDNLGLTANVVAVLSFAEMSNNPQPSGSQVLHNFKMFCLMFCLDLPLYMSCEGLLVWFSHHGMDSGYLFIYILLRVLNQYRLILINVYFLQSR